MKGVKIAILDSVEVVEDIINFYNPIFIELFKSCTFERFANQNVLVDVLQKTTFDILISDLSLGVKEGFQGLNLIKRVKTEWPEIFVIGNSKGEPTYRQTSNKYPTFDLYVDKGKLFAGNDDYILYIKSLIEKKFKRNTEIQIKEDSVLSSKFRNSEDYHINSIVQQCTYTGLPDEFETHLSILNLQPLTGGRSGSDVYRFEAYLTDEKIKCIPAVLKISKRQKACQELANYNKYVKWLLPYTWRVDILGTGFTKEWGGICYSFILSEEKRFDSLTYYISEKKDDILEFVYNSIFSLDKQKWYQIKNTQKNITKRYFDRYFWGDCDVESNYFKEYIQEYFQGIITQNGIKINGIEFNIPYDTLFGKPNNKNYHICICHGDLNSNNIIVSENNSILFIDFQDTGFGHVFEDFITFESSLRLAYPIEIPYSEREYLNFELTMDENLSSSLDNSFKKHIQNIRNLAFKNFPMERKSNYYYGLAAFSFRLLRLETLVEYQKIRIMACLLSCLKKGGPI